MKIWSIQLMHKYNPAPPEPPGPSEPSTLIDSNTLALWHCDVFSEGGTYDTINNVKFPTIQVSSVEGHFNNALRTSFISSQDGYAELLENGVYYDLKGSFTVDYWGRFSGWSFGVPELTLVDSSKNKKLTLLSTASELPYGSVIFYGNNTTTLTAGLTVSEEQWIHYAVSYDVHEDTVYIFQDGILKKKQHLNGTWNGFDMYGMLIRTRGSAGVPYYLDELRISNTCRYKEDFIPPTEPYHY